MRPSWAGWDIHQQLLFGATREEIYDIHLQYILYIYIIGKYIDIIGIIDIMYKTFTYTVLI